MEGISISERKAISYMIHNAQSAKRKYLKVLMECEKCHALILGKLIETLKQKLYQYSYNTTLDLIQKRDQITYYKALIEGYDNLIVCFNEHLDENCKIPRLVELHDTLWDSLGGDVTKAEHALRQFEEMLPKMKGKSKHLKKIRQDAYLAVMMDMDLEKFYVPHAKVLETIGEVARKSNCSLLKTDVDIIKHFSRRSARLAGSFYGLAGLKKE